MACAQLETALAPYMREGETLQVRQYDELLGFVSKPLKESPVASADCLLVLFNYSNHWLKNDRAMKTVVDAVENFNVEEAKKVSASTRNRRPKRLALLKIDGQATTQEDGYEYEKVFISIDSTSLDLDRFTLLQHEMHADRFPMCRVDATGSYHVSLESLHGPYPWNPLAERRIHTLARYEQDVSERLRAFPSISEWEVRTEYSQLIEREKKEEAKRATSVSSKLKGLLYSKKVKPAEKKKEDEEKNVEDPSKAAASTSFSKPEERKALNPVLRILMIGTYDEGSPWHKFGGNDLVLRKIVSYLRDYWRSSIDCGDVYASRAAQDVSFPEFTGININMMPILIGVEHSIPKEYRQYQDVIARCPVRRSEWGSVGYLTIHESVVEEENQSQRRPGLHVESPGRITMSGIPLEDAGSWGPGSHALTLAWGRGMYDCQRELGEYVGGIFMGSTVSNSCRIWNAKVKDPDVINQLGDIEHLRSALPEGYNMAANEIVWMTDMTPHESLPLPAGTKRQYFRLVSSGISVWYSKHSTPNPIGIVPPDHVKIIHTDKFESMTQQTSDGAALHDAEKST